MQFTRKTSYSKSIIGLLIKLFLIAIVFIGIIFLLIQGVSELLKSYWASKKGEWPGESK